MALSSERSQHCPFLNRTDYRCGKHFHLEHLDHAFEFCFDRYTSCSTYLERLVERRLRQDDQSPSSDSAAADSAAADSLLAKGAAAEADGFQSRAAEFRAAEASRNVRQALVQVTISSAVRSTRNAIEASEPPLTIKLATAVPGPRVNAGSLFRGFDRLARRTVFRETVADTGRTKSDDAASRAA